MADRNASTGTNDNLLMIYLERRALQTLHEAVWYYQLVSPENKYKIPANSGTQITFNRWLKIPAASSTLGEASGNSSLAFSSIRYNTTIRSFGRNVKFTDLFEKSSILNVEEGAMRELEQSAALTIDNEMQRAIFKNDILQTGQNSNTKAQLMSVWMSSVASAFCAITSTTSYNANSNLQFGFPATLGTSAARLSAVSATAPSISARLGPIGIRKSVARLRRLAAEPFADGKFRGVIHPNALATMLGNADYKQWVVNYQGGPQETMMVHEVGMVHNVRLLESPNAPRYAVAAHSVNATVICGRQALAATELDGGVQYIITRPGPSSTNDPYQLNSYVAFKVRIVANVVNPSAGTILFTHEKL